MLPNGALYGRWVAAPWRWFGDGGAVAQKSAGNQQTCGIKDTGRLPQRGTGI
jgi:hypothetical protein